MSSVLLYVVYGDKFYDALSCLIIVTGKYLLFTPSPLNLEFAPYPVPVALTPNPCPVFLFGLYYLVFPIIFRSYSLLAEGTIKNNSFLN
jgi:hypothetical protein